MSDRASRFYGMELPAGIEADLTAGLVDLGTADLVRGHLERNRMFFGVIDKTLSGFVVLDDEGDDYWLLDARDTGQGYWQDHETRDVSFFLASIEDYRAYRADAEDGDEDHGILAGYRPKKERPSRRVVSTPDLCARYQWLVPLLARPHVQDGTPIQTFGELTAAAAEAFFAAWTSEADVEKTFRKERSALARDPHLAIYWLLHATLTADDERRRLVLEAVRGSGPELLRAFVDAFGRLDPEGDCALVPDFRARRGRLAYLRARLHGDASGALTALRIAPGDLSHDKAAALEDSRIDDAVLRAGLQAIRTPSAGASYLRALLDRRAGKTESPHADAFAHLVAGDSWPLAIDQLERIAPLVRDGNALAAACDRLEAFDPHHPALAAARLHAAADPEQAGKLRARLAFLTRVADAYRRLLEGAKPADLKDPELRIAVAERVLHRFKVDAPKDKVLGPALKTVAAARRPDGIDLIRRALSSADSRTSLEAVRVLAADIDGPAHPSVEILLDVVARLRSPGTGNYPGMLQVEALMHELLAALGRHAHHPQVFDRLMSLLEKDPDPAFGRSMGERLLRVGKPECILGRLTPEQATRALRAMIRNILGHPDIHVRNELGHALFRFAHPGAEAFLLEALEDHARRHAEGQGADRLLDHGQTEADMLERVVANLYAAVARLGTPASRSALIGRLHRERRSFWRMGDALKSVFTPEVHEAALEALRSDPQPRAVAAYAYTLAEFVKRSAPLLDLARAILGRPLPAGDRGYLKYALQHGTLAGLEAGDYGLVREAHAAVLAIDDAPCSPGGKVDDPFADPKTARKLADVLSGTADRKQEKCRRASAKARQGGAPRLEVDDEELGRLAGAAVRHRIFQDPERGVVWFHDREGRFRYFDGFEVVDPPFRAVSLDSAPQVKAFLKGATQISDQATWWGDSGRDAVRYGDRVLLHSTHGDLLYRTGLACETDREARELFDRLRACPPKGFAECRPWAVPGKGAVVREHEGFDYYFVHRGRIHWRGPAFRTDEEAFAAYRALQLEAMRDRGALCTGLGLQESALQPEDQTVAEWMRDRSRCDDEAALWHLRALPEFRDYLERHGLAGAVRGVSIEVGPGASDADLRDFEKARAHPIPGELRSAWKEIGHAEWRAGARSMRFLSPKEVLARRDALRAGKSGLDAVGLKNVGAQLPVIDALVVDERDRAWVVMADVATSDGRVFAEIADYPATLSLGNKLGWFVSVRFVLEVQAELLRAAPLLRFLPYGQPYDPAEGVRRFECTEKGSSKFWEVSLHGKSGTVGVRYGRIGAEGTVDVKRHADAKAAKKAVDKLIAEKLKKGYREFGPKG